MAILTHLSFGVGLIAVAIIMRGVLAAVVGLVIHELPSRTGSRSAELRDIRLSVASYLVVGLEVLIAADIIRTISQPTLEELAVLGAIVAIRTVITYFLGRELAARG